MTASATSGFATSAFADAGELRRHVLDELRRAMGWELTFLTRIEGSELRIVDTSGPADWVAPGTLVPFEATLCHRMLSGTAPPHTDRGSERDSGYADCEVRVALGIESYSGHAVRRRDGSPVGTLCAIDHLRRPVTAASRDLGEVFARLIAWELEREQLMRELASLASTDGLTGLMNRRVFNERLVEEVERATRYGHALSLIVLDLDHFKRVNDRGGHRAGDAVLADTAALLREHARTTDIVARVGGEEFAVILPETGRRGAVEFAERIRGALARAPLAGDVTVTASLGVCDLSGADDAEALYRLADAALYSAKSAGRNQVVSHGDVHPEAWIS